MNIPEFEASLVGNCVMLRCETEDEAKIVLTWFQAASSSESDIRVMQEPGEA